MFDFYFNIVFVLLAWPNYCVRSFGLTQKNQKVKWLPVLLPWCKRTKKSRLRLLSYSVTAFRCARRKLAALKQRRSGRSTSFLRLTLTRTRPIVQLTIDNWQWTIIFFHLPFINGTGYSTHNFISQPNENQQNNKWIYYVICCFILSRYPEAQHAAPLHSFPIFNSQLSIDEVRA